MYFDYVWKRYLGSFVDSYFLFIEGCVYLNYVDGNYYNVVEFVLNLNVILNINIDRCNIVDDIIERNIKRIKEKEIFEDDVSLRNECGKK